MTVAVGRHTATLNSEGRRRDIITIGGSAGGVEAVRELLSLLPVGFDATVVVVLHRSPFKPSFLVEVLQRCSRLPLTEPESGDLPRQGHVYLAPADRHLSLEGKRFQLHRTPKVHFTRPAVDPLFESAAEAFGPRVVGVLLSGAGSDGLGGLLAIKAAGGLSIVQDPREAQQASMPLHAIRFDHVDAALRVDQISPLLIQLTEGRRIQRRHEGLVPTHQ